MTVDTVRGVLLWSGVINYGLLIFWVVLSLLARNGMYRIGRLFHLSVEQFDALQYAGMTFYKLAIILLFLVPYIALRIVG